MESIRYLLLILMIVNDIHSHQDAVGDIMQSWKDKQEYEINQIKDAIRNMSSLIQEMKHNSEKQRDDFSIMKDTIGNMSTSITELKNNSEKQRDDFSKIKDAVKDVSDLKGKIEVVHKNFTDTVKDVSDLKGKIEVVHKNFTRTLNFICKEPGSLCTPKFYVLSTDTASFIDASTKCKNRNMTFASITNEEEFEALNGHFKSTTVTGNWLRLSGIRVNAASGFYWTPSGQLVTNEKWWPGYPINSDQHNCLFVQLFTDNNSIKFHNNNCNVAYKYVCEYQK